MKKNCLFLRDEYFFPEGVIKKPFLNLTEILPDLRADNFLLFNNFENLMISDFNLFI